MRRQLSTIGIVVLLGTGIAAADPHGGGGAVVRDHRSGGGEAAVVRDHRSSGGGGPVVRDHRSGGGEAAVVRDHRSSGGGGPVVRDHRGYAGGGAVVRDHRGYAGGPAVRDHRGPVHVAGGRYVFPGGVVRTYRAPVIREHYYNRYRRPAYIVESYEPVPGYMWAHGNWQWSGGEWIWMPGYWAVATPPVSAGISVGASVIVD
jgi:hypothetical protein